MPNIPSGAELRLRAMAKLAIRVKLRAKQIPGKKAVCTAACPGIPPRTNPIKEFFERCLLLVAVVLYV